MNELCYDEVDTRDPFRELVRSKDAAYFEANCSWEVQRGGNLKIGRSEIFLIVSKKSTVVYLKG